MKKIGDYKKLIPYGIFLLFGCILFFLPFGNLDELWNYNYARGIANGLKPYSEINMVQTPVAAYLCAAVLRTCGGGLMTYRFVGYCLLSAILSVFYYNLKKQFHNAYMAFLITLLVMEITITTFIYDYNYLSLLIVLIIMSLESEDQLVRNGVIGILTGILPLVKQTTGSAVFVANLLVCCYFCKRSQEDNLAKSIRLVFSFFPSIFFAGYLMCTGKIGNFINYAVLGIREFNHRITFFEFMKESIILTLFAALLIGMVIFILYRLIEIKVYEYQKIMWLLISSIWFLTMTYPLFDIFHYLVGIIPLFLVCGSLVGKIDAEIATERIIKLASVAIMTCLMMILLSGNEYKICELENYEGIRISESMEEHIRAVCDYIETYDEQQIDVLIADSSAAVYMIPQNRYTKNWDMLLKGNLGTITVEELMKFERATVLLICKDDYALNRQSHFELIDYIKKNYKKVDEVQKFDVYQTEEKR